MATVLITGASRGIGLALATQYVARGDAVVGTARVPGKATALAALAGSGPKPRVLALDATSPESLSAFATAASAQTIDTLIVNAGQLEGRGGIDDPANSFEVWSRILSINVTGAFLSVKAALPGLAKSKGGKIAIISSVMGSSSKAAGASYSYRASKAAIANVAANLAVEMKGRGIAVGCYHPGWVRTGMGGPSAAISPEESASGLVQRIDALSLATTGVFEDYAGAAIPF